MASSASAASPETALSTARTLVRIRATSPASMPSGSLRIANTCSTGVRRRSIAAGAASKSQPRSSRKSRRAPVDSNASWSGSSARASSSASIVRVSLRVREADSDRDEELRIGDLYRGRLGGQLRFAVRIEVENQRPIADERILLGNGLRIGDSERAHVEQSLAIADQRVLNREALPLVARHKLDDSVEAFTLELREWVRLLEPRVCFQMALERRQPAGVVSGHVLGGGKGHRPRSERDLDDSMLPWRADGCAFVDRGAEFRVDIFPQVEIGILRYDGLPIGSGHWRAVDHREPGVIPLFDRGLAIGKYRRALEEELVADVLEHALFGRGRRPVKQFG